MTNTEKLLRELIALPSVNPAFLPRGDSRGGERHMAEYLASVAARAGLDVELQSVLPGRPNLLVRLFPSGRVRQRLLLAPHLDTVSGRPDQFRARRTNGRLYGRGACDTKGSIAAMLTALCEAGKTGRRARETEIILAGLVDEENAQAGSRALVHRKDMKADLAVVGEPTRLQVVTAHKGSLWLELKTRGKPAHGARPELGRNAVHAMARVVDAIETDYASKLRVRRHPLLGCATVSVGTIRGGTQPNIVPDECSISVDRRTLPGETEAGVRKEILAFLRSRGLAVTLDNTKGAPCQPLETDPNQPLVQELLSSAGRRKPSGVHFFSDAAVLAEGGIPSVVFGPGDIAQAHTAEEWISLPELEQAKEILRRFLSSLP